MTKKQEGSRHRHLPHNAHALSCATCLKKLFSSAGEAGGAGDLPPPRCFGDAGRDLPDCGREDGGDVGDF